jgi:hypothetical protein
MGTTLGAARFSRTKVTRRLRKWQRELLLSHVKLKIRFEPEPDDDDQCRAGLYAEPEYNKMEIFWDETRVEVETEEDLDAWCIHELLHAKTWRLEVLAEEWAGEDPAKFRQARDVAETTVTNLESVILSLARKAGVLGTARSKRRKKKAG